MSREKKPRETANDADVKNLAPEDRKPAHDGPTQEPTAGVETDSRWGEEWKALSDIHGRVIAVSVEGGMTRITIGAGREQGVHVGMMGYVKGRGGAALTEFQVDRVDRNPGGHVCSALVDLKPEQLHDPHDQTVINYTALPQRPTHDIAGRIIGLSIVQRDDERGITRDKTQLVIALGSIHNVRVGSVVHLLDASGEPKYRFKIAHVDAETSTAVVGATPDMLHGLSQVIVNPESESGAALEHH